MINWIIAIFYFLENLGFLSLSHILTTNLFIILLCRGFYVFTYVLNYRVKGEETLFSRKEIIYYSLKQLIIILFGIIFFPITVAISFYSLMVAGIYLKQIALRKNLKVLKSIGRLIYILSPIIGLIWFSIISADYYSIAAVGIAILVFLHYGLKISGLTLAALVEKYNNRRLEQASKYFKVSLLVVLIVFPFLVILGTGIYTPQAKKRYMVPMSDGIKLATDVYFAPGSFGTPRPVILIRTPYGKSGWATDLYSPIYLLQNYHIIIQDLRGTGQSEGGGNFLLFTESYKDGVDTIEWILAQNWCNGKIASAGVSALCLNQYYYAGMGPKGLLSQQLWFGTPEMFDHAIFQGSYHKSSVETWIKSTAPNNWEYQIDTLFTTIPKNEVLYNSTSLSYPIGPHYSNVSVRAIHVGGWYDHFLQGTIDGYIGYDDNGTSRAREHQMLVMGPWTHGSIYGGQQGELVYPDNSNGFDLLLDWEMKIFDESLLGIPTSWDGARVAYYIMGDVDVSSDKWNYWRYAYDWPLDHVDDKWYFTSDGGLDKNSPGGTNMNYSYLFDPRYPVPNLGGQNQPFDLAGPMDQVPIEDRSDVLIFETPVLSEGVETVGRIWGNLFVTSNCTDTDFTIKLTDVYPDNRSMLVTDGSLTVRYRNGYTTEEFFSGSMLDVYEIFVDCWSSAYYFAPGHKIRVAISSSNYPRYAVNPNTGAPLARDYLNSYIANNTLLVGPAYSSSIILPRLVNTSATHVVI